MYCVPFPVYRTVNRERHTAATIGLIKNYAEQAESLIRARYPILRAGFLRPAPPIFAQRTEIRESRPL